MLLCSWFCVAPATCCPVSGGALARAFSLCCNGFAFHIAMPDIFPIGIHEIHCHVVNLHELRVCQGVKLSCHRSGITALWKRNVVRRGLHASTVLKLCFLSCFYPALYRYVNQRTERFFVTVSPDNLYQGCRCVYTCIHDFRQFFR